MRETAANRVCGDQTHPKIQPQPAKETLLPLSLFLHAAACLIFLKTMIKSLSSKDVWTMPCFRCSANGLYLLRCFPNEMISQCNLQIFDPLEWKEGSMESMKGLTLSGFGRAARLLSARQPLCPTERSELCGAEHWAENFPQSSY